MPEIGEVARIVHYLRKHVVGKTIAAVTAEQDDIVYGKVGCSASSFTKALTGRRILNAGQQGKYFYMLSDGPSQAVLHLGMTGWMKFSNDDSSYYKPAKEEDNSWPPRFVKFILRMKEDDTEVAFVDPRRLARIRLVDCKPEDIRKMSPLKENGPDPVIDKDVLTRDWLAKKLGSKKVPVKALMLDQANISGVGNWVADEVLYQARIHPEQYSNTLNDSQVTSLHDSLINVCTLACEVLADSSKFPEDWLMKHRWGKGKKDANVLPNGAKIIHLKVGGRTSAVVPSVQKKTGPVAGDVSSEDVLDGSGEEEEVALQTKTKKKSKNPKTEVKDEDSEKELEQTNGSKKRKGITSNGAKHEKASKKAKAIKADPEPTPARRRSGRVSKQ